MSTENPVLSDLLNPVVDICVGAGEAILEIYNSDDFVNATDVQTKGDDSPLTKADLAAHKHIVAALEKLTPEIPILSEESANIDWATRKSWKRYWLVDPLDGTKEFIKRNGEFTVNIALIDTHEAVLGVVHVPAQNQTYYAARDVGAYKRDAEGVNHFIQVRKPANKKPIVVGSRSHQSDALKTYLAQLGPHEMTPMGSSLKLCLVAEGGGTGRKQLAEGVQVVRAAVIVVGRDDDGVRVGQGGGQEAGGRRGKDQLGTPDESTKVLYSVCTK